LPDYELTVSGLAEAAGVSRQSINELLRERRSVSPEMALRLGRLFGNSPEFWLNAQRAVDLWDAAEAIKKDVARIKPLNAAQQNHSIDAKKPARLRCGVGHKGAFTWGNPVDKTTVKPIPAQFTGKERVVYKAGGSHHVTA